MARQHLAMVTVRCSRQRWLAVRLWVQSPAWLGSSTTPVPADTPDMPVLGELLGPTLNRSEIAKAPPFGNGKWPPNKISASPFCGEKESVVYEKDFSERTED